ncbi:hypothetical protein VTG60DRAFT_4639 [Thermothelomyces hinnuleus]
MSIQSWGKSPSRPMKKQDRKKGGKSASTLAILRDHALSPRVQSQIHSNRIRHQKQSGDNTTPSNKPRRARGEKKMKSETETVCINHLPLPRSGLIAPATARMKRSTESRRAPAAAAAAAEPGTFSRLASPRLSCIVFSTGGVRVGKALARRRRRRRERAVARLSTPRARVRVGWVAL